METVPRTGTRTSSSQKLQQFQKQSFRSRHALLEQGISKSLLEDSTLPFLKTLQDSLVIIRSLNLTHIYEGIDLCHLINTENIGAMLIYNAKCSPTSQNSAFI